MSRAVSRPPRVRDKLAIPASSAGARVHAYDDAMPASKASRRAVATIVTRVCRFIATLPSVRPDHLAALVAAPVPVRIRTTSPRRKTDRQRLAREPYWRTKVGRLFFGVSTRPVCIEGPRSATGPTGELFHSHCDVECL